MSRVVAAGSVLWRARPDRIGSGGLEIALIHRPKYGDWSLPKGKCEAGENPCVTAVRETREEAGFSGPLTRGLGRVQYEVLGPDEQILPKVVHYWAMPALDGVFSPNDEVDELRWFEPTEALAALTRDADRAPVEQFLAAPAATTTVLLIRHADAGDRQAWPGPDLLRPLNEHGRRQAADIAAVGACFGLATVLSADVVRCVETVAPLAAGLGLTVEEDPAFAENYQAPGRAVARIRALVDEGNLAICSQGGIIPETLEFLSHEDGVALTPRARKGSVWVLSFADGALVAAHYLQDTGPAA